MSNSTSDAIAIIGLHGRFPGASSVEEFWDNLVAGRETISLFTDADLKASGLDPDMLRRAGNYVAARGILKDADLFDAAFFGIHPKEAEVMDPQHRVFLESCWEALERAGYPPSKTEGIVGVYAGATFNTYYLHALHAQNELRELVGHEQVMLGNEKDYLATRVAYKLNLKGPAITLNTGCSSSLVAVCQACQALQTYQCDMALAGGISIRVPQQQGYLHQQGNIGSPDGHTRTFDAEAQGTVFSNGVTLVVLKRLVEAMEDGDQIYAVIKGTALNNDGSERVSFGAPGVEGQAEVVSLAQEFADVPPDSISYIEAHGTATPIGDPIEVAALTKAFRRGTQRKQFCALGSVKSNIGHLDAAAGTAGLIKTALSLHKQQLPPTLHYLRPNPKLNLEESPFFVNATLRDWKPDNGTPLRAGVSSFGTGGTNAHVIVEEAPGIAPGTASRRNQMLLLSAKTPEALEAAARNLATHLESQKDANLADVAYTLQVGRAEFAHRRAILCESISDAVTRLAKPDARNVFTANQEWRDRPVVFMFPGQGAQYAKMGAEVYRQERVFREEVDKCAKILEPILGLDLRRAVFEGGEGTLSDQELRQTRLTQPALFTIEYALAKLWISWGIKPAAMIGHSVGEYVAACLADVLTLEAALTLVARRAELVQSQSRGSMLAARLSEQEVRPYLNGTLALAAINGPNLCVVSGPHEAILGLEKEFSEKGIPARQLPTSHAFHSSMMDPVIAPFRELLSHVKFGSPRIRFVSNVTGKWIGESEAGNPDYWAQHVRQTVLFSAGVAEVMKDARYVLLEVGPGQTLTQLARQHPARTEEQPVIPSLGGVPDQELSALAAALGRLWLAGVSVNGRGFYQHERRRRVVLPTYPFERKRFWPQPQAPALCAIEKQPVCDELASESRSVESADSVPSSLTRKEHLAGLVRSIIQELCGITADNLDINASFLELGLDSLLLTQAATLLRRKFSLDISFRQLMEELETIELLATHLDRYLPEGKFSPQALVKPSANLVLDNGSLRSASVSDKIKQLLQLQMQTASQLLSLYHGEESAPNEQRPAHASGPVQTASQNNGHGPFRPIERASSGKLSDSQQNALQQLIDRYTQRTAGSKRLAAENRAVLADPRSAAGFKQLWKEMVYPIYSERSEGSRLWDVDGNEYIDFVMGFGANLFGHRPSFVIEAIQRQIERGFEIGPIQRLAGETAALICEMTGMERVAFCNTGSEAVLAAMRIARAVTGRDKIATFAGDYHGIFDEVLCRPATINGEPAAMPIAPGIPSSATNQIVALEYGSPQALEWLRNHCAELAAVLVEPVQSRRLDFQPREFLHEVRKITMQANAALIFDEVVTGFRIHPGGAQTWFDVRADIATYGKVIGGGLSIGVVAGAAKYLDALDGGQWQFGDDSFPEVGVTFFAGTFVRHPINLAVAKAVLQHLKKEGPQLQHRVAGTASLAAGCLNDLIARYRAPLRLAQFSSLLYLTVKPEWKHGGLIFYLLREKGIHIFENRAFVFTTAHSEADVQKLASAFEESLKQLQKGGFLEIPDDLERPALRLPEATNGKPQAKSLIPLTEAQREIWLATQIGDMAGKSYNVSFIIHFDGFLEPVALENSFREVVARHDSLRAGFSVTEPLQHLSAHLACSLPVTDLSSLPPSAVSNTLSELAQKQNDEAFDLTHPPLWRVRLLKLGASKHILVLTVHHIIADGWSVGVILHELQHCYEAHRTGRSHDLETPLQISDYVKLLANGDLLKGTIEAERFWQAQFATLPEMIELPTGKSRPAQRTYRALRESVRWDSAFCERIRKASARNKTTALTFLLAGFNILVRRLSGQEDFVIGLPAAGQIAESLQTVDGARAMVGHCVNLLPLRTQCSADTTFDDYLQNLRRAMLDAYEHQDVTFGRLLQLLNIPREPNRVPLVPITFNLDRGLGSFNWLDLRAKMEELPRSSLVFDLSINIVDEDGQFAVHCDFNTDIVDATTVRHWLLCFRNILDAAAANPKKLIGCLPLLTPNESCELLHSLNTPSQMPANPNLPLDGGRTLHKMFEEQVKREGGAVGLVCEGKEMSYGELNARANRVARELRKMGVGPDVLVGLCLERSNELVIGVLGILKAGGAYLPIDLAYPAERLAFMLEDAKAPVLLSQTSLKGKLPETGARVLYVDELLQAPVTNGEAENVESGVGPDHLAYVIYTSGTTGKPKGTMITHRNVSRLFSATEHWYGFNEKDVWTLFHSVAFDFSVWEIWGALLYGGRLVVVPYLVSRSPEAFYELLAKERVTVLNQTPSAFRQLIQAEEAVGQKELALRYVIFGGEALEMQSLRPWYERHGDKEPQLVNMYGITETTVHVTYRPLKKEDMESGSVIGEPIPDLQVYILDSEMQPVPIGVPGEIYVGGAGLARGYLNRPELTEQRFIKDHLSGKEGGRLYRTGDLGRRVGQRDIEYLGRLDQQVKIRGFRIELGEIESVLCQHPAVREAVVMAREEEGTKQLVGYVVVRGTAPSVRELKEHLKKQVPEYMVPAAIVMLEKLPLTNNGKVDRQALPAPESERGQESYVAPTTPVEEKLAEIWAKVLRIQRIGIHDNFFELGGHSLLVLNVLARISQEFAVSVTFPTFFTAPTIAELALTIVEAQIGKLDATEMDNLLAELD